MRSVMFGLSVVAGVALLLAGCGEKGVKCDSKEAKELVKQKSEKRMKAVLAAGLVKGATGDEWESLATQEEKDMVEFNYKEYGPVLANIKNLSGGVDFAECSGELDFRNGQKFTVNYRLQKDANGKLDASALEWK